MPADTIFFFSDLLHVSDTARSLTASGTASGYAINHSRDPNLLTAWKDADSTTADIWLQVDGGSAGWIGAAGETAYCAIAYDSRDNEQDLLRLITDNADNPAMTATTTQITITLTKGGTQPGPKIQWVSFAIPSPAKRYYRLNGPGANRSEATGSKVPKIYSWAMFDKDTAYPMSTAFPSDAPGPGGFEVRHGVSLGRTSSRIPVTNRFAASGQAFDVTLLPASALMWETMRDKLMDQSGPHRAMYVQYEGLRNSDQSNVFLCRFVRINWEAQREYVNQYSVSLRFETEPWL